MRKKVDILMKLSAFVYSVKQGLKNIARNKVFSLASVATMIVCIFMFGILTSVVINVNHIVKEAEGGVAVVAYFNEGLTDEQKMQIGDAIRLRPEVADATYKSAEEAWAEFAPTYFDGDESMMAIFGDDNPLINSDSYQIHLNDVSKQEEFVAYLSSVEGIRSVESNQSVADTLSNFNVLLGYFSAAIVVLLLAVAVFLVSNTVAIGISVRKEEIGIMKLIGATDLMIRAPFLIEGVILGLVGSGLPLLLLYLIYHKVEGFVAEKFGILAGVISFVPAGQVFRYLIPVALVIGVGIGFAGSMLTIRKHLRV